MADFIPQNMHEFNKFVVNFEKGLENIIRNWSHVPVSVKEGLETAIVGFTSQYANMTNESSNFSIKQVRTAKAECEKVLRNFIKYYVRNPIVNTDQLALLGVPPIDNTRTTHFEVTETVDFEIHIKGTNNIIVDFKQTGTGKRAKPKGYSGAVIIWAINEEEPEKFEDFPLHTLATRSPYTIEFENHDSGKRAWIKIAWQNARGHVGRWTEAKSAIIP